MITLNRPDAEHAIVIGGGIAGLLATRVLLKHFGQVTLIERDHYPTDPVFRAGVPQGHQVHTMLLRGQQVLEEVFPGLRAKLLAQGAFERDYGNDAIYYYGGGRCPSIPPVPALHGWNCSRLLLEWQLRQELMLYPQLRFMEGYEVVQLLYESETEAVDGVQIRPRNHSQNESNDVRGSLVIDASGSSSHISQWLKDLGYQAPVETVVDSFLGYATRFYAPPDETNVVCKGIVIQGNDENRRGGVLMTIEGGRWMVVLAGPNKDYPPTDEEGYLAFAESLADTALYEAMKEAVPVSPIYGYRRTENRLRHFERTHLPEGLLILGDAVCSFNPLYGQGMTVAAQEALVLEACLRSSKGKKGLTRLFQKKIARVLIMPWNLATTADARITATKKRISLSQRYIEQVVAALPHEKAVFLTFLEVVHMLRPPAALMHPAILVKVLVHTWKSQAKRTERNSL